MSRRSRKKAKAVSTAKPQSYVAWLKSHLSKALVLLLGTGAVGGGAGYVKGTGADERAAKLEQRMDTTEKDAGHLARRVERMDRRTTRIETLIELELDQHKVPRGKRPPRAMGPEEE